MILVLTRGNTPDVQIGLWFSSWDIVMLSGKFGEIAAMLKSRLINICLKEVKGKGAKAVGIEYNISGPMLLPRGWNANC